MEHTHKSAWSPCRNSYSGTPVLLRVLIFTVSIYLGLSPECFAFTTAPSALTFDAIQGEANPLNQTLSVYRDRSTQVTLSTSDNVSWLTVSPATTSMTNTVQLTVSVNTSGLAPGTHSATISVKVGKKVRTKVPVTLTVSPSSQSPPSATTATLTWDSVTDPYLDGYNIHVGTASGLYTRILTVGNVTSYTVDGLTMGVTYYFTVTAHNSAGESQFSNEVSKSIY